MRKERIFQQTLNTHSLQAVTYFCIDTFQIRKKTIFFLSLMVVVKSPKLLLATAINY